MMPNNDDPYQSPKTDDIAPLPEDREAVVLTTAASPYEAASIVGALEEAGIDAVTDGDLVGFNYTEVINYPVIRVAKGDAERAAVVFREWEANVVARREERLAEEKGSEQDDANDERSLVGRTLWADDGLATSIPYFIVYVVLGGLLFNFAIGFIGFLFLSMRAIFE